MYRLPLLRDDNSMIESSHASSLLSGQELARVRTMAIRRGIWYRMLNASERALFDLTIRIVRKIRSSILSRVLASIIGKLQVRTKCRFAASLHSWGQPIAERISTIAQAWGNASAVKWSVDSTFIRFLEIMQLNAPVTYMTTKARLLKRG